MTDLILDPTNPVHAKALSRLASEEIGWLGTTGRDGFPHAVPVWFLWHDEAVIALSQPKAAKTKNLQADPRAMFHLEAGDDGEQLQVLQGSAELSAEPAAAWLPRLGDEYRAKYASGLERLGLTLEQMAEDYSVVVIIRPHKLIAW